MTWIIHGRRNRFAVKIYENGARKKDLSEITRWVVSIGCSNTIDSEDYPEAFNWTGYDDPEDGYDVLLCNFGSIALPTGVQPLGVVYYEGDDTTVGVEAENYQNISIRGTSLVDSGVTPVLNDYVLWNGDYILFNTAKEMFSN